MNSKYSSGQDILTPLQRAYCMSRIKGENTKPEMAVRKFLHAAGFRFRLHKKDLPGRPDLVLAKYRLAIFVHGCFWHRHTDCAYASVPSSNQEFWLAKFSRNVERDSEQYATLRNIGWRILIIWECGLKIEMNKIGEVIPIILDDTTFATWPDKPPKPTRFI